MEGQEAGTGIEKEETEDAPPPGKPEGFLPGNQEESLDRAARVILKMASYQKVSIKDILSILTDMTEEEVSERVASLARDGLLLRTETPTGLFYRKAG